MSMLGGLKKAIGMSPIPTFMRRFRSGLRVVLYHHVGEEDEFTRHLGCTTSEETFEAHVDWYARNYDVVTMDDILGRDPLPRRPLLITFDDAYKSVLDTAGRILLSRGLPSTLFLVTDPVFRGRMVLDNLLSFACCRRRESVEDLCPAPCADPVHDVLFHVIPDRGLTERDRIRETLSEEHGEEADRLARRTGLYLREGDLPTLADYGISIARHTASHVNMRLVEDPGFEVEDEWASCGMDPGIRAFSFPFGGFSDAEATIRRIVEAGIGPSFLVEGCSNQVGQKVYYRTSPKTDSVDNLNADLEVLSVIRRMRKRSRIASIEDQA